MAEETEVPRPAFRPRWGAIAAVVGLLAGYVFELQVDDAIIGAGIGFLLGGAAPLFRGIWQYLAVFLALTGGFIWLLVHYVK